MPFIFPLSILREVDKYTLTSHLLLVVLKSLMSNFTKALELRLLVF